MLSGKYQQKDRTNCRVLQKCRMAQISKFLLNLFLARLSLLNPVLSRVTLAILQLPSDLDDLTHLTIEEWLESPDSAAEDEEYYMYLRNKENFK